MNRGAWWATVQTVADRVGHDLVTKQQQRECSPQSSSPGHIAIAGDGCLGLGILLQLGSAQRGQVFLQMGCKFSLGFI